MIDLVLASHLALAQGHGQNGSLSPEDLRVHYGVPKELTGAGQTVAIIMSDAGTVVEESLAQFDEAYHLPVCTSLNGCFKMIDFADSFNEPDLKSFESEATLDVEMVHAMAPLAKIVLLNAPKSAGPSSFIRALHQAEAIPGVTSISMSFTTIEVGSAKWREEDSTYARLEAEKGLMFFASSGDEGHKTKAEYPAASPYVTAVGGTRIQSVVWPEKNSTGAEVAWMGSGGGYADRQPMPPWQRAVMSNDLYIANEGMRIVPDVSAVADRDSPVSIFYNGRWSYLGGTSVAAPLWAGISALLAQALAHERKTLPELIKNSPGGLNGLLYQASMSRKNTFHDITIGSNSTVSDPLTVAKKGYDEVTGLGSPNVENLVSYWKHFSKKRYSKTSK